MIDNENDYLKKVEETIERLIQAVCFEHKPADQPCSCVIGGGKDASVSAGPAGGGCPELRLALALVRMHRDAMALPREGRPGPVPTCTRGMLLQELARYVAACQPERAASLLSELGRWLKPGCPDCDLYVEPYTKAPQYRDSTASPRCPSCRSKRAARTRSERSIARELREAAEESDMAEGETEDLSDGPNYEEDDT